MVISCDQGRTLVWPAHGQHTMPVGERRANTEVFMSSFYRVLGIVIVILTLATEYHPTIDMPDWLTVGLIVLGLLLTFVVARIEHGSWVEREFKRHFGVDASRDADFAIVQRAVNDALRLRAQSLSDAYYKQDRLRRQISAQEVSLEDGESAMREVVTLIDYERRQFYVPRDIADKAGFTVFESYSDYMAPVKIAKFLRPLGSYRYNPERRITPKLMKELEKRERISGLVSSL